MNNAAINAINMCSSHMGGAIQDEDVKRTLASVCGGCV